MPDVVAKSENGHLRVREVADYQTDYGPEDDGGIVRILLSELDGEYLIEAEHNTDWFIFDANKIADNLTELDGDFVKLEEDLQEGLSVYTADVRMLDDESSILVSIAMQTTVNENEWTDAGIADALLDYGDFLDWTDSDYSTLILESRRIVTDLHKGTVDEYWTYVDRTGPVLVENVLEAAEDFLAENE